MPKGIQGFQKGHPCYLTREQYAKIGRKSSITRKERYSGVCFNTGRTHFKVGVPNNVGSDNPMWKGGRTISNEGYVLIKMSNHPMAGRDGYVREHRFVMANYLKRMLSEGEIVHHINGIKTDNHIENLKLMVARVHTSQHSNKKQIYICLVCGKEIIDSPSHQRKYCSLACFHKSGNGHLHT